MNFTSSDELRDGLGNVNISEDFGGKKKLKMRTTKPHYLTGTANSRAKKVTKSPMATKRATSPMNTKKTKSPMSKTKQPKPSVWIEELPMDELKLEYNHFRNAYKEFRVLSELTITVLQDMGIFLKPLLRNTTG